MTAPCGRTHCSVILRPGERCPVCAATARPRHKAAEGECAVCDELRSEGETLHPPHDASPRCERGRHNHCSCDTCF